MPLASPAPPRALGRVLMVQGTSSHAGKSTLVAALCRIFAQDGLRVAPFKAQNMSLNAAVTPDGGEIGRAQMLQAQAARVLATVQMNPVLLKPQGERTSQIVVLGKALKTASVTEYYAMRQALWPAITEALDALRCEHDVVVIEGAGSPAEINLKTRDLANMRVARYAGAPVLLVGDIERGGVFASLVGTMVLLEPEERQLVRGFVINKFRGDASLLEPGPAMLREHTGLPTLGILPYLRDINLPEEDSLGLDAGGATDGGVLDVVVIRLPHIANFDDFDPLRREPGVRLRYVASPSELGAPDLVILPGSKTTVDDLGWLRERGLAQLIVERRRGGTPVVGICGGYQMLGEYIDDPGGVESGRARVEGLALLPTVTEFTANKVTRQVHATIVRDDGVLAGCGGVAVRGYEMHMGRSVATAARPVLRVSDHSGAAVAEADGAADADGLTIGTYLHGLFHNHALRRRLLERLAERKGLALPPADGVQDLDAELDKLAAHVRRHLDLDAVYAMTELRA